MSSGGFLGLALHLSLAILALSIILVFIRMLHGPSLCNRVVAFDLLTALMACAMGLYIILEDQKILIVVVILLALISFLGTVGYAYYVEREKQ